jgi:hypothetical protein
MENIAPSQSRSRILTSTVLFLLLGLFGSCYRTRVQSDAPSRKHTIAIQEWCQLIDCAIKITTTRFGLEQVLWRGGDCVIRMASIVWNEDGTKAGVLLALSYCPNVYMTYDFMTGTLRPGEEMEVLQAASLLQHYGVPVGLPDRNPRTIVDSALDPSFDGGRMSATFQRRYP